MVLKQYGAKKQQENGGAPTQALRSSAILCSGWTSKDKQESVKDLSCHGATCTVNPTISRGAGRRDTGAPLAADVCDRLAHVPD